MNENVKNAPTDGGPAFPSQPTRLITDGKTVEPIGFSGMSKRDYFAAHALVGLLSGQYDSSSSYNLSEVPEEAFKIADAMLVESDKAEGRS